MVKTWSTPVAAEEKQIIPCNLCGGQNFKTHLSCEGFSYVRCVDCDLVQMNPQPLWGEVKKRYGNDYLAYELANEESFLNLQVLALEDAGFSELERELMPKGAHKSENFAANSRKILQVRQAPRVLDIGCATASLLARLRGRGWECAGVEISGPQAEYGRLKRGLDVRDLPLEENHFPEGSFDAALASHLIEHLNDPAGLVREVRRILAPGGRFFVSTPNIDGFQARLFGSSWRSAIFDHLYLFSAKTLSALLRENGFAIEKTATWGGLAKGIAPAPLKRLFDKAAKRLGFGDVMIIRGRKFDREILQ